MMTGHPHHVHHLCVTRGITCGNRSVSSFYDRMFVLIIHQNTAKRMIAFRAGIASNVHGHLRRKRWGAQQACALASRAFWLVSRQRRREEAQVRLMRQQQWQACASSLASRASWLVSKQRRRAAGASSLAFLLVSWLLLDLCSRGEKGRACSVTVARKGKG